MSIVNNPWTARTGALVAGLALTAGLIAAAPAGAATAPAAPGTPTVSTDGEHARVTVRVTSDGGSPITRFVATCTSSDGGATSTGESEDSPVEVETLTFGKTYTCVATVTNAVGTSAPSPESAPFVADPTAPTPTTTTPPTTTPPATSPPTATTTTPTPTTTVPPVTTTTTPKPPTSGPLAAIPSDCSTDVTNALNTAIAGARSGSTLTLAPGGCYRVEGTVAVSSKVGLTIDGNGATVRATTLGAQARTHLRITGGRNVTVRNLTIVGTNATPGSGSYRPALAFQHGITIRGVDTALVDNVTITNVWGDLIYVGDQAGVRSRNVIVTRSRLEGSGRQGFTVVAGDRITFDRNYLGNAALSLIDLEANTGAGGATNVTISNNHTGPARHFWLANKGAGTNIRNIVVDGNVADTPTSGLVFVFGPTTGYRGPFTFTNNTFRVNVAVSDEGSKGVFFFSRARGITIMGNTVTVHPARPRPAVELRDADGLTLGGNTWFNITTEVITTVRI